MQPICNNRRMLQACLRSVENLDLDYAALRSVRQIFLPGIFLAMSFLPSPILAHLGTAQPSKYRMYEAGSLKISFQSATLL